MNGHFLGGFHAQANFVTPNINNSHDYIITNHDALIAMSGKDKHRRLLLLC